MRYRRRYNARDPERGLSRATFGVNVWLGSVCVNGVLYTMYAVQVMYSVPFSNAPRTSCTVPRTSLYSTSNYACTAVHYLYIVHHCTLYITVLRGTMYSDVQCTMMYNVQCTMMYNAHQCTMHDDVQ